jgi:hypothetical protein
MRQHSKVIFGITDQQLMVTVAGLIVIDTVGIMRLGCVNSLVLSVSMWFGS